MALIRGLVEAREETLRFRFAGIRGCGRRFPIHRYVTFHGFPSYGHTSPS